MSKPLVSVIVPTYNVERYVEDCIDSLISQTYPNIEIIVIDDGSKDATVYLLNQYKDKIKLIAHDNNKGQGARRNQGIKLAKGEYIYFVDSDDWIEKDTIKELVEQAVKTGADLVRFNGKAFSEGGVTLKKEGQYNFSHQLEHKKVYTGEDLLDKNRRSFSASPCLYLIKKSVIDQHNLYFLEGVLHEDEYFTTRLFCAVESMTYINKPHYNRRYRVASTMTEQSNLHKLKSFESYLKIFKALEKDYQRPELKPAQKQFIKRQLLSVYNGLQQADIHPVNKRKLKELKSVTFKDKVFLVLAKIKQRM